MSIYTVQDLSFRWTENSKYLFKNLNLSIEKGNLTAIIGKNGTGKTTLLKLLASLINPSSGTISLNKIDIRSMSRKQIAKNIAYVSQDPNENISIKVREMVNLGNFPNRKFFNTNERSLKDNVKHSLNITKTSHLAERFYNTLSGGEKQKVMISRALCQQTNIILLDEPTSSLDIKNKIEILGLLSKLAQKQNLTIITISHDLNLVLKYADNIMIMSKNNILHGKNAEIMTIQNLNNAFETKIKIVKIKKDKVIYY